MVMAQSPSTQYVAHEFVRQYYMMLHKDPTQLHRFYTRESRLTHGVSPNAKSEDPVCGQEAINEKISQLHFRNCYSKIRSVDSHPTIGGGVVIQVTGELSNAGMAMRKFMQTFVLAQQEPKKYHVFNDIFRYQDETFEDTENEDGTVDGTIESENGYNNNHNVQEVVHRNIVDIMHTSSDVPSSVPPNENEDTSPYSNVEKHVDESLTVSYDNVNREVAEVTAQESTLEEEKIDDVETSSANSETPVNEDAPDSNDADEENPVQETELSSEATNIKGSNDSLSEKEVRPSGPVSWAALAKKNTPVTANPPPAGIKQPVQKKRDHTSQRPKKREEISVPRKDAPDESRRRNPPAPDNHQIFIGNLPSNITEKDVREAFKDAGNIVEVRLNPKNFGFVAFDGVEAPNSILLSQQHIVINGHTINIEVKRSVSGSGRSGGGGGGGFRRGDRDSGRGRNDMNKNSNKSSQSRPVKNTQYNSTQYNSKQARNNEESKLDKNKENKSSKDQKPSRR